MQLVVNKRTQAVPSRCPLQNRKIWVLNPASSLREEFSSPGRVAGSPGQGLLGEADVCTAPSSCHFSSIMDLRHRCSPTILCTHHLQLRSGLAGLHPSCGTSYKPFPKGNGNSRCSAVPMAIQHSPPNRSRHRRQAWNKH